MPSPHRWLPALLLALLACQSPPTAERTVLANYHFHSVHADPTYGSRAGEDIGLHWFSDGWHPPKGQGVWTSQPTATWHFQALGRDLELELVVSSDPDPDGPREIVVSVNQHEMETLRASTRRDTLRISIPHGQLRGEMNRVDFSIDGLTPYAREHRRGLRLHILRLTAVLTAPERAEWEAMVGAPPPDPRWDAIPVPDPPVTSGGPQPDLLLVVMDTMRADHTSALGYDRDTTPHLARLAEGGVLLTQVIADAPYTSSAVPSLFTGQSWHEHGVFGPDRALPPEAFTLAEILSDRGYQTRAISDNPNVSRGRGSDQGFGEFLQTWDLKTGKTGWQPEAAEELVYQSLERGLTDQPYFYYVHLMPPHAPYVPGEAHDLWRAEGYDGPIHGDLQEPNRFDRGEFPAEGPDFDRLISLYDGGAHRGDAIVGRILERFEGLPRDRPRLTVVLSDHGEGFGEHGRFSHNTTPYDEMVHVPVVLHPAGLASPLLASPHALRSLSDMMPLLLSCLDVPLPPGRRWPARFLEVMADPTREREAVFVRAAEPFFAVRTPTALTVFKLWSRQETYDLTTDPGAQTNLRLERPGMYREHLRWLRSFVEVDRAVGAAVDAELSPADVERLKALGYL